MTTLKAIELLNYSLKANTMLLSPDDIDALKLGIAALRILNHLEGIEYRHPKAHVSIDSILKSDLEV